MNSSMSKPTQLSLANYPKLLPSGAASKSPVDVIGAGCTLFEGDALSGLYHCDCNQDEGKVLIDDFASVPNSDDEDFIPAYGELVNEKMAEVFQYPWWEDSDTVEDDLVSSPQSNQWDRGITEVARTDPNPCDQTSPVMRVRRASLIAGARIGIVSPAPTTPLRESNGLECITKVVL
ncbi:MAG: hypothetical protein IAE83_21435 [Anaerolinea sp.]|nr:hypothetical protein [Anaerolinea sp.]